MSSRRADLEMIARRALEIAEDSFPSYYHRFAPKVFRLPQLVACLILKVYLRQDYRGCEELLKVSPPLQKASGLKRVPNYSTLSRAFNKATPARLESMLEAVLKRAGVNEGEVALDATGLQAGTASAYYQARRGKRRRGWVKLSLAILIPSFLPASARATWGHTNDHKCFLPTMEPAVQRVQITRLYADAGYDAEWIHNWCRNRNKIESWIPAREMSPGHRRTRGFWRKHMARGLPRKYGRRWAADTVNSVIKRKWGDTTTSRTRPGQKREALLRTAVTVCRQRPSRRSRRRSPMSTGEPRS